MTDQTPSTEDYPLPSNSAIQYIRADWVLAESTYTGRSRAECLAAFNAALRAHDAARDRGIAAKALREAADALPEYDLPFLVNGRAVIHVYHWLNDRAASIGAGDE